MRRLLLLLALAGCTPGPIFPGDVDYEERCTVYVDPGSYKTNPSREIFRRQTAWQNTNWHRCRPPKIMLVEIG